MSHDVPCLILQPVLPQTSDSFPRILVRKIGAISPGKPISEAVPINVVLPIGLALAVFSFLNGALEKKLRINSDYFDFNGILFVEEKIRIDLQVGQAITTWADLFCTMLTSNMHAKQCIVICSSAASGFLHAGG